MMKTKDKDPGHSDKRELIIIAVIWAITLSLLYIIFWKIEILSNY